MNIQDQGGFMPFVHPPKRLYFILNNFENDLNDYYAAKFLEY